MALWIIGGSFGQPDTRPSVILIVTDDQNVASMAYMPLLQAELVEKGAAFVNGFVTAPQCCPSRVSILRGQYIHNHHILHGQPPHGGYAKVSKTDLEDSTIATWLNDAGYNTALFGKYLNGYSNNAIPAGWDVWYAWAENPGSERKRSYVNYALNENGALTHYGAAPQDYMTDVLTEKALAFIADSADSGQPFFVYYAPIAPHTPARPADRHRDLFTTVELPRSPSYNEQDTRDKPTHIRDLPLLDTARYARFSAYYRDYLRSLQSVDDAVAAFVEKLNALGVLDNTYIIYISDNGFHFGEHRLSRGKGYHYEEDIRVPFVIRGPGIPAGVKPEAFVLNIDLAPTIADIADITPPDFVDGRSLLPLLSGSNAAPSRKRFVVSLLNDANVRCVEVRREGPCFNLLRTERYAYIEYRDSGEIELYDMVADPHQLNNIAAVVDLEVLADLSTRLDNLLKCSGKTCRKRENRFKPLQAQAKTG